jgi:ArsR family metal-binding transcriptional regulator
LSLIDDFEIELSTPDCDLESQIYKASVTFDADITEALPYVNAIVEKAEFIPGIPVLVWTEDAHKYALRPREIAISNITERREAGILARKIVDRINSTWEKKDELEPSYESYERPKVRAGLSPTRSRRTSKASRIAPRSAPTNVPASVRP